MDWDKYDEAAFGEAERKFRRQSLEDDVDDDDYDDLDAKSIMQMTEVEYDEWIKRQEGLDEDDEDDVRGVKYTQDEGIELLEFLNDWAAWDEYLDEQDALLEQYDDLGPKGPVGKEDIILEEYDEVEELSDSEFDWHSWFHGFI